MAGLVRRKRDTNSNRERVDCTSCLAGTLLPSSTLHLRSFTSIRTLYRLYLGPSHSLHAPFTLSTTLHLVIPKTTRFVTGADAIPPPLPLLPSSSACHWATTSGSTRLGKVRSSSFDRGLHSRRTPLRSFGLGTWARYDRREGATLPGLLANLVLSGAGTYGTVVSRRWPGIRGGEGRQS